MTGKAFAELSPTGDRIEVHFRYDPDLVRSIKEVPGAKFVPVDNGGPHWTVPLNLQVARRLNEEMGPGFVLGQALRVWGKEAKKREHNLQSLAAIDSLAPKDLKLQKKLPDLTEWMRGYQRADTKFLSSTSAVNANEQRLGKTTEIIAAVFEADMENGPHLVCAPKSSLQTVWRFEIERWTAKLPKPHEVITYSGSLPQDERTKAIDEFWACVDDDWPVWFVCTFDTVRMGQEPFFDPKEFPDGWNTFVIDEFHRSGLTNASGKKDGGSKFAQAVKEINAQRRYALSGTPMGGKPIKLWGAFHFLYPKQFTSKWQWAKTWLQMDSSRWGTEIGNILPGREDEFYRAHAPYMVRRLRSEVLPQLPPAQWIDVPCEMTPKQKKQYDTFARQAEAEIEDKKLNALGILAQYTRLKVFADAYCDRIEERDRPCPDCNSTGVLESGHECYTCGGSGRLLSLHPIPSYESGKLEPLMDRLAEQGITAKEAEGESLAIVASQFKQVADMVHRYLNEKGIKAVQITGGTSDEDRIKNQMMFRMDGKRKPDDPRVIVMTTTAGGVAITLDLVENVHILDETWVPDDQEQLADRAVNTSRMHQIGVYVYRSLQTVEQHIQDTNIDKRNINKSILDLRRQGFRADMKKEAAGARN